jgi:hypothetical protein
MYLGMCERLEIEKVDTISTSLSMMMVAV